MKAFFNAILGMIVLFAGAMCAIGSTGYLLNDGHYLFAVVVLITFGFAAKPMWMFAKSRLGL